ncbi:hypothetical protein NDU88_005951 [Pleurodeles waltl]|uniref:Uncharacterized protein n=1 Tax=Pleurodeles waltl TaxID=8319 RepID=A0AAV7SN52_PLEWA|nr:hypothetical protein NDU88_005951 [Pleurodeles waltl]
MRTSVLSVFSFSRLSVIQVATSFMPSCSLVLADVGLLGGAEGGSLGYAADDLRGCGSEGGEADSLGPSGEEGDDPFQGLASDAGAAEAVYQGAVADRVEGCREIQENEGHGFTLVGQGSDVVRGCDEGGFGAVVGPESELSGVEGVGGFQGGGELSVDDFLNHFGGER